MNKFFLIVLLAFVMTGCQSYKKSPLSAGCRGRIAWSSERTAV